MRLLSVRWPLRYLVTGDGFCLGVDLRRGSYLLLGSRAGLVFRRRPAGDRLVERLDYRIPRIAAALDAEASSGELTR